MKLIGNWKLKIGNCPRRGAGMTFIELIVVIGIFSVIAGVALFNFSGFSSNITLQNLANQIALQIKQAQSDAIAGKQSYLFTAPDRPSYGISFSSNPSGPVATTQKFIYFADIDNDKELNGTTIGCGTAGAECQTEINIQSSDLINKICAYYENSWNCNPSGQTDQLFVTFRRPFPDAKFVYGTVGTLNNPMLISQVAIEIKSVKNLSKHIVVWSTGQIEVKNGELEF